MIKDFAGISVLEPTGDLGQREMTTLCKTIQSLFEKEWVYVVLNLSQVTHLHYEAVQKLVLSLVTLRLAHGDLKIAHLSSYHRKIFEFAGIHNHFETYDSLAEAVLSFDGSRSDDSWGHASA
ncbi:MAG: STAS domain-containing protein [Deltaproteobacteria bacterium]|nr:STAS domain-containing protein [Deltaproteobacteria bacterium]